MDDQACHAIRPSCRKGRFAALLICLLSLFTVRPFLTEMVSIRLLMDIFLSLILISGTYAVSQQRAVFLIGLILAIPALATGWLPYVRPAADTPAVFLLLEMLFVGYTTGVIQIYLFRETRVTSDVITGAVCAYFLMGLTWAFLFNLLQIYNPASFTSAGTLDISQFVYFSFVTMTTVGYGDITPLTTAARSLSLLEAVTGQLYVAILIARLVGMHIAQAALPRQRN